MRMLSPISTEWSWPNRRLSSNIMGEVFEDFDRLVDSFLRPNVTSTIGFQPTCDINETKGHYLVSFDVPGLKKEDIKIQVEGNQLLISGERQREMKEDSFEMGLRHERAYGKFERVFSLPTSIDADKIEAHYENGVLNIALPKAEAAKGRTVQIQTGEAGFFNRLLGVKKTGTKDLKDANAS